MEPGVERLVWMQPRLTEPRYELRDPGRSDVVGRLDFDPLPTFAWGMTNARAARADVRGETWALSVERGGIKGFFGLAATIHASGRSSATLEAGAAFARGDLDVRGRHLQWKLAPARRGPGEFLSEDGTVLVRFLAGIPPERINARVDVPPAGLDRPELPLLLALGFYVRVLARRAWI
jgi:hypothetical protein